jgi:hypothetical protein
MALTPPGTYSGEVGHVAESRVFGSHGHPRKQSILRVNMGASFNGRDHSHASVSNKQLMTRCSLQNDHGGRARILTPGNITSSALDP